MPAPKKSSGYVAGSGRLAKQAAAKKLKGASKSKPKPRPAPR